MIFVLSLIFFSLDFLLKRIIDANLSLGVSQPLVKNFLYLTLIHNRGAAFGLFQGKTYFLIIVSIIFIFLFVFWLAKKKYPFSKKLYLSMVLGGALSNLYDRIFLGYVIDYIDLRWWPVFNLSDTFISLGCILFLLTSFFKRSPKKYSGDL